MDPAYRKILQKNIVIFRRDMVKVEEVAEHLWANDVLSESMKDEILSGANPSRGNKASALHTLIPKRGQRAFELYYRALRDTLNDDLADILEPHIAEERRLPRVTATVGGATHYHSQESMSKQPEPDETDLPDNWPDRDADPLSVEVKKCDVNDSVMSKHFNNSKHVYSMKGKATGVRVLIINNKTFNAKSQDTQKSLEERDGTDIDATALDMLFTKLGYKSVKTESDLTGQEIIEALENEAGQCQTTDNAFICVILSHGTIGSVYGVDGDPVKLEKLYDQFNGKKCPNLEGKPKLFFIQACQGGQKDGASGDAESDNYIDLNQQFTRLNIEEESTDSPVNSPTMADILVSTATTEGYVSWRNSKTGTWFIQALVYVIQNYAYRCDLQEMLTKTNALIGNQVTQKKGYKQCAEKRDTFRKKFYFFPGFEDSGSFF